MTERVPDYPSRTIAIHVTQGEDLVIEGEQAFAPWELDAVYNELSTRQSALHCEGCACEEVDHEEGGNTV